MTRSGAGLVVLVVVAGVLGVGYAWNRVKAARVSALEGQIEALGSCIAGNQTVIDYYWNEDINATAAGVQSRMANWTKVMADNNQWKE